MMGCDCDDGDDDIEDESEVNGYNYCHTVIIMLYGLITMSKSSVKIRYYSTNNHFTVLSRVLNLQPFRCNNWKYSNICSFTFLRL